MVDDMNETFYRARSRADMGLLIYHASSHKLKYLIEELKQKREAKLCKIVVNYTHSTKY